MVTNPPCALFQIMTTGCSCRRLVLTMLFLTTLLTLSSSASLPSLLRKFRHGVVTKNNDCIQDMACRPSATTAAPSTLPTSTPSTPGAATRPTVTERSALSCTRKSRREEEGTRGINNPLHLGLPSSRPLCSGAVSYTHLTLPTNAEV